MKNRNLAIALLLAAGIAGCGGGGGSSSSHQPPADPGTDPGTGSGEDATTTALSGSFVDAPVGGLKYTVAHATGHAAFDCEATGCLTDADGTFQYHEGDTITFSVGNRTLGSVLGNSVITPETVAAAVVAANPSADQSTVRDNMLVFLQSLDADGNPDNGIDISAEISSAVESAGTSIDFTASAENFDAAMVSLVGAVPAVSATPVSREAARSHFETQMAGNVIGSYAWSDANSTIDPIRTLTLFRSGVYLMGTVENDPTCEETGSDVNGNGIGVGTWAYDHAAGTMTFTQSFETMGDCGISSGVYPVQFDGNLLTFEEEEEGVASNFYFARVPQSAAGVGGSWLLPSTALRTQPMAVSFFPTSPGASSGRYLIADSQQADGADPGIEYGCYSISATDVPTFDLDASTCAGAVDTNGAEGFSGTTGKSLKVDDYGRLELVAEVNGADLPITFMPISGGPVTTADLAGVWYMEMASGSDPQSHEQMFVLAINGQTGSYAFGTQHAFADADECSASTYPSVFGTQEPNGNGVETGMLNIVSAAGVVRPAIDPASGVDTNGDCGLFNVWAQNEGNPNLFLIRPNKAQNALLMWSKDDDELEGLVFKRAPTVTNSLTGAWRHYDELGNLTGQFTVFFPNQVFTMLYYHGDPVEQGIRREGYTFTGGSSLYIDGPSIGTRCVDTTDGNYCSEADESWGVTFDENLAVGTFDGGSEMRKIVPAP